MSETPTPEELRALLAKATPGPWEFDSDWCCYADDVGNSPVIEPTEGTEIEISEADAALVVAMRNALPGLLKRLRDADELNAYLREGGGTIAAVRAIDIARADEREQCARVADSIAIEGDEYPEQVASGIAAAIRALGAKEGA